MRSIVDDAHATIKVEPAILWFQRMNIDLFPQCIGVINTPLSF